MLNKNGWGFRTFIIAGSILFIALIITSFFIIRLYSSLPNLNALMNEPLDYEDIEENLVESSLNYINKYYDEEITTGVIVISTDNLLKYNVIEKKDLIETTNEDECRGYALIRKEEGNLVSTSYIKCNNYITEGYQDWRISNNG